MDTDNLRDTLNYPNNIVLVESRIREDEVYIEYFLGNIELTSVTPPNHEEETLEGGMHLHMPGESIYHKEYQSQKRDEYKIRIDNYILIPPSKINEVKTKEEFVLFEGINPIYSNMLTKNKECIAMFLSKFGIKETEDLGKIIRQYREYLRRNYST